MMEGRLMRTTIGDLAPESPAGKCCSVCGCIVTLILLILFFPCTITRLGQFKMGLKKNMVTGVVDLKKTYEPGLHWIGFWSKFIEFPTTLNTIEFSDEKPEEGVQYLSMLQSRDKDGKQVFLDVTIQYILKPEKLGTLYKEMTLMYEGILISELRDTLSKAGNLFAISEVWTNYATVATLLKKTCDEALDRRHAICWGLQLWGVTLTDRYQNQLVRTEVQKQAQITRAFTKNKAEVESATRTRLASYTAEIKRITGTVDASILNMTKGAEAEAQGKLVLADAQILSFIRDNVVINTTNMTGDPAEIGKLGNMRLANDELVEFKKASMLTAKRDAPFIYRPFHPDASILARLSK